ncbi:recombinase family protein [Brucella tritici]|uniref:Recombinase family protein n=1 Tax=Brucella tritici TaxID=94626 RepID=A0A7V7VQ99_9HYPH|nr:recombinase family protein [Brucella tritici]KAB2654865.1 recombinase family protein [Brucella tritici]
MKRPNTKQRLIGYARVSTEDQQTDAQTAELQAAGCTRIVTEHGSGASRARPALTRLISNISAGDVLVVVRLDRLARSVSHLLAVIEDLTDRGAHFRSLHDPIDTSTPQGMFSLQVLGAVAQLERALISERTKAGVRSAKAKGRMPGNPGLRARKPAAIAKISAARRSNHEAELRSTMDSWMPIVKRMRPGNSWEDVTRVLALSGIVWTQERLRRSVKALVASGLASPELLERALPSPPEDRLMKLVAGIAAANPDLSLRDIAGQLEKLRERTPRGGLKWSASSVKNQLDRAQQLGLVSPADSDAEPSAGA